MYVKKILFVAPRVFCLHSSPVTCTVHVRMFTCVSSGVCRVTPRLGCVCVFIANAVGMCLCLVCRSSLQPPQHIHTVCTPHVRCLCKWSHLCDTVTKRIPIWFRMTRGSVFVDCCRRRGFTTLGDVLCWPVINPPNGFCSFNEAEDVLGCIDRLRVCVCVCACLPPMPRVFQDCEFVKIKKRHS